jgi:1,4-alpha-glucan branching enzyme
MPASQLNITDITPMGANLIAGGATFRTWAREALEVYVALGDPGVAQPSKWTKNPNDLLVRDANGYWTGFFPGVKDGDEYRYYIVGKGDSGFKRDPYARELQLDGYPECNCIVRTADNYQWRAPSFRPPPFEDLLIYQFHIGVFYAKNDAGQDIRANEADKGVRPSRWWR